MFISQIVIKNYRLFTSDNLLKIDNFNIPNGTEEGSGLNVFVGENGCGKTSLLEALSLPILEYKADSFSIDDMNDPSKDVEISVFSDKPFKVLGTMPKSDFSAQGFIFKARCRARGSKAYLSSLVVTDQLFISADPDKPKDGSPDLRVRVNNPFAGSRFNENDVVLLDKNRLYQTRSGNFNTTRFDRLMEDFNYQYLKNTSPIKDLNDYLNKEIKENKIQNSFLEKAINKFKEFSGIKISLDFIDNYRPFNNAYFVAERENKQQIHIRLDELSEYIYYFQFTLNAYGKDVEPNVPSKNEIVIPTFQKLSRKIGKEKVVWRYDPILINENYTTEYHLKYFKMLVDKLAGYTEKCTVSFLDLYKNTQQNTASLRIKNPSAERRIDATIF